MDDSGVVGDKLMIKVGKAKEGVYFLDFSGGWPGSNAVKFDRVYDKLTRFYDHPKVFDFRNIKLTLFKLKVEVKLSHVLENTVSSFSMGLWVRGSNEKVIHVNDEPSFSDHVLEGVVHELLECSWGIAKTKEYNSGFKESIVSDTVKAAFHWWLSLIQMLLYPHWMLNLMK